MASSIGITVRVLDDLGKMKERFAQIVFSFWECIFITLANICAKMGERIKKVVMFSTSIVKASK